MQIRIFDTKEQAGIYAATLIERIVLDTIHPVLGLATGSTVIPLYSELVRFARCGLNFSRVTTFNLDEYVGLPEAHEQSYRTFMNNHLFSKVNVPKEHIFIPCGWTEDLDEECARYDELLAANPIDVQVLGIGINGHIGFNEPNHMLITKTHVVDLSSKTMTSNARFFGDISEVPKRAVTMGIQSILRARKIVLLAFGDEKADIVAKAIEGDIRPDVPASILQLHSDVTIVLDKPCARGLCQCLK